MFKKQLLRIEKIIIFLLLLFLPTQLALHFWPSWAFVFGIRVDLLSPSIYLTDILVILLFVANLVHDKKSLFKFLLKYRLYILAIFSFMVINTLFSTSPPVSTYKWLKMVEFTFLVYYFSKQEIMRTPTIIKTVLFSSALFSLIGILQFIKGETLGGILYYLGERSFNISTPSIALVAINGVEHLRAYSTFSHPNSLAGFLGVTIVIALVGGYYKKLRWMMAAIIISSFCFVLTFSVSAYAAILLVLLLYAVSMRLKITGQLDKIFLFLSIFISLLMPFVSSFVLNRSLTVPQNLSQRLDLAAISGKLISQRFFFGGGLGTFVINATTISGFMNPWLLQPVHNIFLLAFTEMGLIGILLFCLLFFKLFSKNPLLFVFIIFTGLLDHYWLTLQQNLLLLSILSGLSFRIKQQDKSF